MQAMLLLIKGAAADAMHHDGPTGKSLSAICGSS